MPETMPLISVVICTRNRPEDVATCLPTVLGCDYPQFKIILVDQSTNDATARQMPAFQSRCPALTYLPTTTVGKSIALDLGIAAAQGDLLAFTDDDCEVTGDWLRKIQAAFHTDPRADILFGPVLPSPALDGVADACVPSWSFSTARYLRRNEVCGMGANMALRRRVLTALPGPRLFDPILGPGASFPAGEEGDFVYRIRRTGAVAALRPELMLYHRAYRTPERWSSVLRDYGRGDAAFYVKHARCGDAHALGAMSRVLMLQIARYTWRRLRRKPSDLSYLRGFLRGLQESRKIQIDHRTRLYVTPDRTDINRSGVHTQDSTPTPDRLFGDRPGGVARL